MKCVLAFIGNDETKNQSDETFNFLFAHNTYKYVLLVFHRIDTLGYIYSLDHFANIALCFVNCVVGKIYNFTRRYN